MPECYDSPSGKLKLYLDGYGMDFLWRLETNVLNFSGCGSDSLLSRLRAIGAVPGAYEEASADALSLAARMEAEGNVP